jgi:hypothetical protein
LFRHGDESEEFDDVEYLSRIVEASPRSGQTSRSTSPNRSHF